MAQEDPVTANIENWLRAGSVRHDDAHSLRVNRTLAPGVAEKRNWRCTCGHDFGSLFDNAAHGAYRAHRKATS